MAILFANLLYGIAIVLDMILGFFIFFIIARALISWVNPDPYNPIVRFLTSTTDPLIFWVRRYLPKIGGPVDFSPLIVLLALYFLKAFLVQTLFDYSQVLRPRMITTLLQLAWSAG